MTEREPIDIKEMPSKDVLEDYLMSQWTNVPVGVVFDGQVFKRVMARTEWLEMTTQYKQKEEEYIKNNEPLWKGIIDFE